MRILHVLDHSIPLQSGYSFRTLSLLREQRQLGWDTFQVTSPRQDSGSILSEYVDGWLFYRTRLPKSPFQRWPVLKEAALMRNLTLRLRDLLQQLRPDILHTHSPVLNAMSALRIGREFGIPVIYEIRAFWEDAAVDHGTAREWGIRYRSTRSLETYALRRVDAITTICEGLRQDLIARNISEDRITVVPNGVNPEDFPMIADRDKALTRSLGLEDKEVLGFVGSFYEYEGLDLLLLSLPRLLSVRPNTAILLVGGGPEESRLKALAKTLRIENKVIFAGRVPQNKVTEYYSLMDILVYPRRLSRLTQLVTPLKPLEAMAQGRLVVASDVGGHRELIRHRQTGVLFEAGNVSSLADAVLELLSHRKGWNTLKEQARRFIERERTWKQSVGKYCSVYEALMRKTRSRFHVEEVCR